MKEFIKQKLINFIYYLFTAKSGGRIITLRTETTLLPTNQFLIVEALIVNGKTIDSKVLLTEDITLLEKEN